MMVLSEDGQYLAALVYISPGQEEQLPNLMARSQVYRTGKLAAAWKYRTRSSTLGRS